MSELPISLSQEEFYRTCLLFLDTYPKDECSICCYEFENGEDIVKMKLCGHTFHRPCIIQWFHAQLHHRSGDRNSCGLCSCPFCRRDLFQVFDLQAREISQNNLKQLLYGRHAGERRELESYRALTLEEAKRIQGDSFLRKVAKRAGVFPPYTVPIPEPPVIALEDTAQIPAPFYPYPYLNNDIRSDVESLTIFIGNAIPPDVRVTREPIDWIDMLDDIRLDWISSGYPRSEYAQERELQDLLICAGLLFRLVDLFPANHTVTYAQLLARGDRLLYEAQVRARSSSADSTYRQLLDWGDIVSSDEVEPPSLLQWIRWIASLRISTRGLRAPPLGVVEDHLVQHTVPMRRPLRTQSIDTE